MAKLNDKQDEFLLNIAWLVIYAHKIGYKVTLGRGRETPEQNALVGGIKESLHCVGLAQDLNLFKDGKYLIKTEDYKPLGEWWKKRGSDYCWGGDFQDGNHFSITYQGRK